MTIPLEGPARPTWVRTDPARFLNLPNFDFAPHYLEVSNPYGEAVPRMHYLDEGPSDAPVVLMAHGEPSWSFLYRKMVPVFAAAGLRALAPDHMGFGKSDKLTLPAHYTFDQHVVWLQELVLRLDLRNITLVCQDWGGPIGLAVLAREPERFARVVAGNTMLHTAEPKLAGRIAWANHSLEAGVQAVEAALLAWLTTSHRVETFAASMAVAGTVARGISSEDLAAYDAPFPSEWHRAGMRQFPALIPVTAEDAGSLLNQATWEVLTQFDRPFLTLFGDSDPPTRGWEKIFQERVPGAMGQPHQILERAGHFWQEDCGAEAAAIIVDWLRASA